MTTLTDTAGQTHTPATECVVVDQILSWTSPDGDLLVHVGDLILDRGEFTEVTEIDWDPDKHQRARVRLCYFGEGRARFVDPDALVAVRRYVETLTSSPV